MAIHAGKREFYERIHKTEKSEAEKATEEKINARQKMIAHKRGVHQTKRRDR